MSEEVNSLFRNLGDAKITSIAWLESDLRIQMRLPAEHAQRDLQVVFEFVTRLKITFDYGQYSGEPLVYQATAETLANGGFKIEFEFGAAPNGSLTFECNRVLPCLGSLTELPTPAVASSHRP
jgi:hypothetical protein